MNSDMYENVTYGPLQFLGAGDIQNTYIVDEYILMMISIIY